MTRMHVAHGQKPLVLLLVVGLSGCEHTANCFDVDVPSRTVAEADLHVSVDSMRVIAWRKLRDPKSKALETEELVLCTRHAERSTLSHWMRSDHVAHWGLFYVAGGPLPYRTFGGKVSNGQLSDYMKSLFWYQPERYEFEIEYGKCTSGEGDPTSC